MTITPAAIEQVCHSLESDRFGEWLPTFGRDGLRDLVERIGFEFTRTDEAAEQDLDRLRAEEAAAPGFTTPTPIDTTRFRL